MPVDAQIFAQSQVKSKKKSSRLQIVLYANIFTLGICLQGGGGRGPSAPPSGYAPESDL